MTFRYQSHCGLEAIGHPSNSVAYLVAKNHMIIQAKTYCKHFKIHTDEMHIKK